jgi:glycosyltransferase involved in cell wall biosynthesis
MTPKISIVTAYKNRKESLLNTLRSIEKSVCRGDLEVVITDDVSDDKNQIGDLLQLGFSFPIKTIIVQPEQRWWKNPCVPFNLAIKQAEGKTIILQNPENYHVTDIVKHALDNVNDTNYITYKVFALTEDQSKDLPGTIVQTPFETISVAGHPNGWYNHPRHRAGYYHFVSAISADVLKNKLGGFDERFAQGWGFDDDDLIIRINRLGLNKSIVEEHLALHQWHPGSVPFNPTNEGLRNQILGEKTIKANV